ncbi:unnamed protein product, partial [Dovyalis caffra]
MASRRIDAANNNIDRNNVKNKNIGIRDKYPFHSGHTITQQVEKLQITTTSNNMQLLEYASFNLFIALQGVSVESLEDNISNRACGLEILAS